MTEYESSERRQDTVPGWLKWLVVIVVALAFAVVIRSAIRNQRHQEGSSPTRLLTGEECFQLDPMSAVFVREVLEIRSTETGLPALRLRSSVGSGPIDQEGSWYVFGKSTAQVGDTLVYIDGNQYRVDLDDPVTTPYIPSG